MSSNDFDDFEDDAFASSGAPNAFDAFDDDAFGGNTAKQLEKLDTPPPAWPSSRSIDFAAGERRTKDPSRDQAQGKKRPAPAPPTQPSISNPRSNFDSFDDDAPPPPPPDSEISDDENSFEPPSPKNAPPPPPKRGQAPPPRNLPPTKREEIKVLPGNHSARPFVAPPSPSSSVEEDDDDDMAPPPPPPPPARGAPLPPPRSVAVSSKPPPKRSQLDYSSEEDAAPPPPGPPPMSDFDDSFDEDDSPVPPGPPPAFGDEDYEPAPPGPPPPFDDHDSYYDMDEPPVPPPAYDDHDEEDDEFQQQARLARSSRSSYNTRRPQQYDGEETKFSPPNSPPPPPEDGVSEFSPPNSPPPPPNDYYDDQEEYQPAPPPPHPSKSVPPPVPVRSGPGVVLRKSAQSESDSDSPIKPVPSNRESNVEQLQQDWSDSPLVFVQPPPSQQSSAKVPVNNLSSEAMDQEDSTRMVAKKLSSEALARTSSTTQMAESDLPSPPSVQLGRKSSSERFESVPNKKESHESIESMTNAVPTRRNSQDTVSSSSKFIPMRKDSQEAISRKASQEILDDDSNVEAFDETKIGETVSRRSSQDSIEVHPPDHPPPPTHAPPPIVNEASHLRRASSSLLAPSEERQIALRFLRAVDTQTRVLNGVLVGSLRSAYDACDSDGDGRVSFVEMAAALKMVDPEMSIDQAMRFVSGLGVQAGMRSNRDFFASATEFASSLCAVAGVDFVDGEGMTDDQVDFGTEEKDEYFGGSHWTIPSGFERSLEQYAKWIDSLVGVWPAPIEDLPEALRSGVLLCRLVEHLIKQREDPNFTLRGVTAKPRTRAPCVQNIELALGVVWKQRVAARNMPSAERIFNADPVAATALMKEVFGAMAMPSVSHRDMFEWVAGVLRHYPNHRTLASHVVRPPHRGLWAAFGGGDALACLIHFFCGPEGGDRLPAVDLSRFILSPSRAKDVRDNARELFALLVKCDVPVPWAENDFVVAQDHEMLLLQIANVYSRFKDAACALPLVVPGGTAPSRTKQWVAVDKDGEVEVVGVTFGHGSGSDHTNTTTEMVAVRQGTRSYTGFHSFSSDDQQQQHMQHHEGGDVAGEVFFLVSPVMGVPPPAVVSEALVRSSNASLENALSRSGPSCAITIDPQRRQIQSMPLKASTSSEDPVAEIKERMRARIHTVRRGSSSDDSQRAGEERRLMELEDRRRKMFLSAQRKNTPVSTMKSSTAKDDDNERAKAAFAWLGTPRDVLFHNRNSTDNCRMFVSKVEGSPDYALEWFDAANEGDSGSVKLSEVFEILSTTADDGRLFVLVHLVASHAVRTSKGRPVLKIEPLKRQDALRFYANVTTLLDEVKRAKLEGRLVLQPGDAEEY